MSIIMIGSIPRWCRTASSAASALALAAGAQALGAERVRIDRFAIDATEVTIAQFREFARADSRKSIAEKEGGGFEWGAGWERRPGWAVHQPFGREPQSPQEPAVHATWQEAQDYCRWRGGRLPTTHEWRLAAYTETRSSPGEGYQTGRTYPYPVGEVPDGMNTNGSDAWPVHAPVGSTKPGVNGLFDMGGNVWEWLADRRGNEALTAGGSWWYGAAQARADGVQWKPADFHAVYVGFRCAYSVD
jgi:sulfatase modifying factor 1